MNKSTKLALIALTGALATVGATTDAQAAKGDHEKCYGVVKAGANDCGSVHHSCAGQATMDSDKGEWVYVPKGLCAKLTGGSLEAAK
ncbi:MAG: putative membrane protein [Alphaproteobacteria bacterium]|jgi:uncharacterized membrane protein